MEALKIVVNGDNDIAKKAAELFGQLGYYVSESDHVTAYGWAIRKLSGEYYANPLSFNHDDARLIGIADLEEMLLLKRNDPCDATHKDQDGWDWLLINGNAYCWAIQGSKPASWIKESLDHVELKEIVKGCEEYLDPRDWSVKTATQGGAICVDWLEIPEGAEFAVAFQDTFLNPDACYFYKEDTAMDDLQIYKGFQWTRSGWMSREHLTENSTGMTVVWERKAKRVRDAITFDLALRARRDENIKYASLAEKAQAQQDEMQFKRDMAKIEFSGMGHVAKDPATLYHYSASFSDIRRTEHYDGVIHSDEKIQNQADYARLRGAIAKRHDKQHWEIQVHSLTVIG